jgi:hypothetical protein
MSSASAKPRVPQIPVSPDPAPADAALAPAGRAWLTALWCSFLAAGLATMLCFAFVDPAPVAALLRPAGSASGRTGLYSLGFLFIWASCALAAGLTAWLMRPATR